MKEPDVLKRAGQSPLKKLYRTPKFKRAWARTWLRDLTDEVKRGSSDRVVAICARQYIRARAVVLKLK